MGQSTSKAKEGLADASEELDNLSNLAMKQIDIFRAEVKETRGNEAVLSKTEVTGGRTLRFKVIPRYYDATPPADERLVCIAGK